MVMFNEKVDAKGVMKTVYHNPLDMWRNKAMESPCLARVARRVQAIPATQAQSERMVLTAGLTLNKRRGSVDPENVELLVFLRCNWTTVDEWQGLEEMPGLTLVVSSCCAFVFRLNSLGV